MSELKTQNHNSPLAAGVQHNLQGINQAFKERDVQKMAKARGIPYVNLMGLPMNPDFAAVLPLAEAEPAQAGLFFKSGNRLKLAVVNPDDPITQALVSTFSAKGYQISLHLASYESVQSAHRVYEKFSQQHPPQDAPQDELMARDLGSAMEEIQNLEHLKQKIANATADVALNYITAGAYRTNASDIHFEPQKELTVVRFRLDGILHSVFEIATKMYLAILTEVKYAARMKANISDVPQDGQFSFQTQSRSINVRVSTLPTQYGETTVMRLLDSAKAFVDFDQLGFTGRCLEHVKQAVALPYGLILITGPTGSGKTTTLYSMLHRIDIKQKKVITLEDPIEYSLKGISQSQVHPEKGFDFATGLRAILRQDPDLIMVGEIRDLETAEIASQAALTGHLVMSTLHTNSAIEAIPRLVNMGVKSFILAPALKLIVAQRLVRRLCLCAQESALNAGEKKAIEPVLNSLQAKGVISPLPATLKQARGCDACNHTGYLGQVGIIETLWFDDRLRNFILEGRPMPEIYKYIEQEIKMLTMQEDGILKVLQGITTLQEVMRVSSLGF